MKFEQPQIPTVEDLHRAACGEIQLAWRIPEGARIQRIVLSSEQNGKMPELWMWEYSSPPEKRFTTSDSSIFKLDLNVYPWLREWLAWGCSHGSDGDITALATGPIRFVDIVSPNTYWELQDEYDRWRLPLRKELRVIPQNSSNIVASLTPKKSTAPRPETRAETIVLFLKSIDQWPLQAYSKKSGHKRAEKDLARKNFCEPPGTWTASMFEKAWETILKSNSTPQPSVKIEERGT